MRFVQHPAIRPHRCAVLPIMGAHNSRGFIDSGQDSRADDHIYVSVEAVEQMARFIGWEQSTGRTQAEAKVKAKDERIAELETEVEELERFRDAAEYTLGSFGAKVRNKPGRKAAA
jgi:hypothetical protein